MVQNSCELFYFELCEWVNVMFLLIVINFSGLFNEVGGKFYEMDFDGVIVVGICDGLLRFGDQMVDLVQVEVFVMVFEVVMGCVFMLQELVEGLVLVVVGGVDFMGE